MSIVYAGLDLGSSYFHQVAVTEAGQTTVNRSFPTSEANLRKAFADLRGELHVHLEAGVSAGSPRGQPAWGAHNQPSEIKRDFGGHGDLYA